MLYYQPFKAGSRKNKETEKRKLRSLCIHASRLCRFAVFQTNQLSLSPSLKSLVLCSTSKVACHNSTQACDHHSVRSHTGTMYVSCVADVSAIQAGTTRSLSACLSTLVMLCYSVLLFRKPDSFCQHCFLPLALAVPKRRQALALDGRQKPPQHLERGNHHTRQVLLFVS